MRVMTVSVVVCLICQLQMARAQRREVRGVVVDSASGSALFGATVVISRLGDSTANGAVGDRRGRFVVRGASDGANLLRVSYVGYKPYVDTIDISKVGGVIDTVRLVQDAILGASIIVTQSRLRTLQKSDTTEYDALAFKVAPDADADKLIKQLPGVAFDGGKIRAMGEEVDKVLVDGQVFFGYDAMQTLTNLPADIVDKVQIYDTKSEAAQFTGADEQSTTKTINIVTQQDKRFGYFGKSQAGYGLANRYQGSGSFNRFDSTYRLSVLAMANNINDQSFDFNDVFRAVGPEQSMEQGGSMMIFNDGSLDDFFDGDRQGITQTKSAATTFANTKGPIKITGSYNVKNRITDVASSLLRQFVTPELAEQRFRQADTTVQTATSHNVRLNAKIDLDSASQMSVVTGVRFNNATNSSRFSGATINGSDTLSTNSTQSGTESDGSTITASVNLRHRFAKPRRSFEVEAALSRSASDQTRRLNALAGSAAMPQTSDTTDQRGTQSDQRTQLTPKISYTEPLTERSELIIKVDGELQTSKADRQTRIMPSGQGAYTLLDTALSNAFEQDLSQLASSVGYVWHDSVWRFTSGLRYQTADLAGTNTFPATTSTSKAFRNVLPWLSVSLNDMQNTYVSFDYTMSTELPTISQMQNVLDNSNPLLLSIGAPDLRQSVTNTIRGMYHTSIPSIDGWGYVSFNVGLTNDYIGTSTVIANRDSVVDGVPLLTGAQLTRPINLDGALTSQIYGYFGFRVDTLPLRLSGSFSVTYGITPGLINQARNEATSPGTSLSISADYDLGEKFTLGITADYSRGSVTNSLRSDLNSTFSWLNASANVSWTIVKGLRLKADLTNRRNGGLSAGFAQNIMLLNVSLKQSLLAGDRGQLELSVRDALNQNNDVNRTFSNVFTEDRSTAILRRVVLLTFSYRFREFGE
jgi:hypothetical protein